jgi:hypothetical protein
MMHPVLCVTHGQVQLGLSGGFARRWLICQEGGTKFVDVIHTQEGAAIEVI